MNEIKEFDHVRLVLNEGKITTYIDVSTGTKRKGFPQRLTKANLAKLYVLKENDEFLYVGTTLQSLTSRIRYGLYASGKNGYHGYKWKYKEIVELFVWRFEGLDKIQLEGIEAELVYLIRNMTGKWPLSQNEIHFNNEFVRSKFYAKSLFNIMFYESVDTSIAVSTGLGSLFTPKPDQWGLRGDPYLWKALSYSIAKENIPASEDEFKGLLFDHFTKLTGSKPIQGQNYHVEEFAFGGMSSGMVCSDFWLERGFPLLLNRFKEYIIVK